MPVFYAFAVTFHGLWNFSVVLFVIGGIMSSTQIVPGLILALLGGVMLLTCILFLAVALIATPIILKRRKESSGVSKLTPA